MLVIVLAACQRTAYLDSIHSGHTRTFDTSRPSFDVEAYTTSWGDTSGVQVLVRIPHASLTFLARDRTRQARYDLVVQLRDASGKRLQTETSISRSIEGRGGAQAFVLLEENLPAQPGHYLVEAILTDTNARRSLQRSQRVQVHPVAADKPFVSRIQLAGSQEGEARQAIPSLYVSQASDSLAVSVRLGGLQALREPQITMHLLRFRADTSYAVPPDWPRITEQVSFRFSEVDTIQTSMRSLASERGVNSGVFTLPTLARGAYQVIIHLEARGRRTEIVLQVTQERFFAVLPPDFPAVTHLENMVEALVYIAEEKEWQAMMEQPMPERKRQFDAFWGRHVRQRARAADLVERYYARVEEANRRFTTHKEGWKTDRGMVYIVMGPPLQVEQKIDRELWWYRYEEAETPSYFEFERGYRYGLSNPFEAYALRRNINYHQVWERAIRRWRRGDV